MTYCLFLRKPQTIETLEPLVWRPQAHRTAVGTDVRWEHGMATFAVPCSQHRPLSELMARLAYWILFCVWGYLQTCLFNQLLLLHIHLPVCLCWSVTAPSIIDLYGDIWSVESIKRRSSFRMCSVFVMLWLLCKFSMVSCITSRRSVKVFHS